MTLNDLVLSHEGIRLKPYMDSTGHLTIGVGRDLDQDGISHDEAMLLFANDLGRCTSQASRAFSWFDGLNDVRQAVIVDMLFNLGLAGLFEFKKFLAAVAQSDWLDASAQMLDSKWAEEVGQRARDLAAMMQTGRWPDPS